MPSRAYTSFLLKTILSAVTSMTVSMPSRAYTSFLQLYRRTSKKYNETIVSMPSRAYTSFLPRANSRSSLLKIHLVSMPSRAYTSFLQHFSSIELEEGCPCQCPLGLIPHFYKDDGRPFPKWMIECQCPLGLIPHFYVEGGEKHECILSVSMPSRAYTSFLRYPFKNLDFMRFPEPVFAGIYQNILTTAVFHAC